MLVKQRKRLAGLEHAERKEVLRKKRYLQEQSSIRVDKPRLRLKRRALRILSNAPGHRVGADNAAASGKPDSPQTTTLVVEKAQRRQNLKRNYDKTFGASDSTEEEKSIPANKIRRLSNALGDRTSLYNVVGLAGGETEKSAGVGSNIEWWRHRASEQENLVLFEDDPSQFDANTPPRGPKSEAHGIPDEASDQQRQRFKIEKVELHSGEQPSADPLAADTILFVYRLDRVTANTFAFNRVSRAAATSSIDLDKIAWDKSDLLDALKRIGGEGATWRGSNTNPDPERLFIKNASMIQPHDEGESFYLHVTLRRKPHDTFTHRNLRI